PPILPPFPTRRSSDLTNSFPSALELPDDADKRATASVNVPLEGLADRTVYNRERTRGWINVPLVPLQADGFAGNFDGAPFGWGRSEEHTSELQSRENL